MTTREAEQQWQMIEAGFDWRRVRRVMTLLKWTWREQGVPTIDELKACVHRLCLELVEHKAAWISTGGFCVEKYKSEVHGERLRVTFSVAEYDTDDAL